MNWLTDKHLLLLSIAFGIIPAVLIAFVCQAIYSWDVISEASLHSFSFSALFLEGVCGTAVSLLYVYRLALQNRFIRIIVIGFPCMLLNVIFLYALLLFIPLL